MVIIRTLISLYFSVYIELVIYIKTSNLGVFWFFYLVSEEKNLQLFYTLRWLSEIDSVTHFFPQTRRVEQSLFQTEDELTFWIIEVWRDIFYPIPHLKPVNSVTIKNLHLFYNSSPVREKKIATGASARH